MFDPEKAYKKLSKAHRKRMMVRNDDMRLVMNTQEGKRVLWEIMESGGMMGANLNTDPISMARFEGRRSLALEIYSWIMEAAPGSMLSVLKDQAHIMGANDEDETDSREETEE